MAVTKTISPPAAELSQAEANAAFQLGSVAYKASKADDADAVFPSGEYSDPFDYYDIQDETRRKITKEKSGHWLAGWNWSRVGEPIIAISSVAIDGDVVPRSLSKREQAVDDVTDELVLQKRRVNEKHEEWSTKKEELAEAKKVWDAETRTVMKLLDALEDAKNGQMLLFNKSEIIHGEHPDVAAGNNKPLGTPGLEVVAKEKAAESSKLMADAEAVIDGKKTKIGKSILVKLDSQNLSTVSQFREFRKSVVLWPENLGLTDKQTDQLSDIMDGYDGLHPKSAEPATAPAPKTATDPKTDESGLFVSGYDEPEIRIPFRKLSNYHAKIELVECADGLIRAAYDAGEHDLEIDPAISFTPHITSPGYKTRTEAAIAAANLIDQEVPEELEFYANRRDDLRVFIERNIPEMALDSEGAVS